MRRHALSVFAIVVGFFTQASIAIYEDSAYKNDFHHSLLGVPRPHTTFFHHPSSGSNASLLYTLSNKNVLGAVNPKDGNLIWRQSVLSGSGNGNHSLGYLSATGSEIISGVGGTVRAWDAADGKLTWEWDAPGTVLGLELAKHEGDDAAVLVLSKDAEGHGYVAHLVATTGQLMWQHKDERYSTQQVHLE